MKTKTILLFGTLLCLFLLCQPAHAIIIINEFLADPPSGSIGDANNDGTTSSSQDEFIEILNMADTETSLSGWHINDAVGTKHLFEAGTILLPYEFLAVFGGGLPDLPGINWQIASTGSLRLNNSGDTITLFDSGGSEISQVVYRSEGGNNQSLVRFPEGVGSEFILHSTAPGAEGQLFSPGRSIAGETIYGSAVVPEGLTMLYFALGGIAIVFKKKKRVL